MDTTGDTTGTLRGFLTRALGSDIGDDDDYFALGMVNSLFALELVTFVEHRFGFAVEVDDLDLDNFRTLARLSAFVRAKTGHATTGHATTGHATTGHATTERAWT